MPDLPRLSGEHWPRSAYPRTELPERVLQFGTGMLLRAVCAACVDEANRAGAFEGRIVVVQSTPRGRANVINAQDGLFTLVERGLEDGVPVERTRLVGSISRALVADAEWPAVREVGASMERPSRGRAAGARARARAAGWGRAPRGAGWWPAPGSGGSSAARAAQ